MEKEQKLKELVLSVLETSQEAYILQNRLNLIRDQIVQSYILYNLDPTAYSNEIYKSLGTRFTMYLQNHLAGSWQRKRQEVVLDMIKKISPQSIVDLGFGVPEIYIMDYVFQNDSKATLVDFHKSAFILAENLLDLRDEDWKEKVFFKNLDLNHQQYVGDYDCYLFLDSVEHINNASRYLKKTVKKSPVGSNFILSIPIGPKIPSHTIEWRTEEEVVNWLEDCGLIITEKRKVYLNPDVDLFANDLDKEVYNLIVTCSKKHSITKLPLLDKISSQHKTLENTLLIVCHHVLDSNFILLDYLMKSGIKPQNVFLMGKSYSTSESAFKNYQRFKINISKKSLAFDSHQSFDKQFNQYVKDFLTKIQKKDLSGYDRILIMDDGGELLLQANEVFKDDPRVVGVEQTSSGHNRLSKIKLNFPVVSVARSKTKLVHETPFIIEAVSKELHKRLRQMDRKIENVLVLGNGPIGKELAKDFREDHRVFVYDKEENKSEIGKKELLDVLPNIDLILGCTGAVSLPEACHSLLKENVILASASSSDREFDSHKIRIGHPQTSNTHKDFSSSGIILLNGGFPINFDGHKYSVPLEEIQITEALMYAGAVQAINSSPGKGMVPLDNEIQDLIIEEFEKLAI